MSVQDDRPRLPAANEFTPGQFGGRPEAVFDLLAWFHADKSRAVVEERIRETWFSESAGQRQDADERLEQQRKRAANVTTGMQQYGLLEVGHREATLTDLGKSVLALRDDPPSAFETFSRFLLRERHGFALLEAASAVRRRVRGGTVTKEAVDRELVSRDFIVPTNSSYSGKLRQWLEVAGIVDSAWNVNEDALESTAGVAPAAAREWRLMSSEQQATIRVLRSRAAGNRTPIASRDLLELIRLSGSEFPEAQVSRRIYVPLAEAGWIEQDERKSQGRGSKGGTITATAKTLEFDLEFVEGLRFGILPPDLQEQLDRPTDDIFRDLKSEDRYVKGIALELLAVRIASECGLIPAELRERGTRTGGAEVDLVAEGAHLHFSRWLFQCKNEINTIGLSVLAKEIGMATLMRAQVVVIVTTKGFAQTVRDYAAQVQEATAIQVILLDGELLATYQTKGANALRDELRALSREALGLKRGQLAKVPMERRE